jgi:hypothetical protein
LAVTEAEWKRLMQKWPAEDREKLRELLQDTAAGVQVVAKANADVCRIMIRLLADT